MFPTAPADYTVVNPRPAAPESVDGDLRVAAMNTLNYFLTLDYPNPPTTNPPTPPHPLDNKCGPLLSVECRGADFDQPDELVRQRTKLIAALSGLDADVIGLNELENTTGVEPLADIVANLPGYAYIDTGTIGTDAIKVGLIYRPSEVTPVGAFQVLDSTDDPRFVDTKSRPALAQTFQDNTTGGKFTVVVNHFKSKGSDCLDLSDPDTGDGSGNCNVTRTNAAEALVDWLATDPTASGDPDFLIMGDLNSYAMEDPIDQIKEGADDVAGSADDFTNLIAAFQGADAYSYTFDGQAGYLDHALVERLHDRPGGRRNRLAHQLRRARRARLRHEFQAAGAGRALRAQRLACVRPRPGGGGHRPRQRGASAEAGGPYTVVEGQTVTLAATGVDPEGSALTYAWDLNNDGTYETAGQSVPFKPTRRRRRC